MLLVKIQKNTNYEGNILEFQKDLIKEDNNKNKVEVMTTNKEEKYQKIIYISYKYFSNTIIIF